MNSFCVEGNLISDPKYFGEDPDKPTMVAFTIAENAWTKKRGKHTVFWKVSCFGRAAAYAARVACKGTKCFVVQGRLDEEEWDAKEGGKRRGFALTAIEATYTGKFKQTQEQAEASGAQTDDWNRETSNFEGGGFDGLD